MDTDALKPITETEFGQLFAQYKPRFVTIANGYVRDMMVAQDIVSDCFVAFWENAGRLPADVNAPAYIMTSVRNKCLNWLREQETHLRIEQNLHSIRQRVIQSSIRSLEICDPQSLFADEVAEIVARTLEEMPQLMRSAFVGSRYMDKTYKEIAGENGITVRQAEYELRKAVKALQNALKDYLPAATILLIINGLL